MKIFKWNKGTTIAVLIFTIVLTVFLSVAVSKAHASKYDGFYIGLGHTVSKSSNTHGEVGYRYRGYSASVESLGFGDEKGEKLKPSLLYSVSRVVNPDFCGYAGCVKMAIGLAYVPDRVLVGDYNYRLEVIWQSIKVVEIFYKHYSSAGTFENNTGVDAIGLRLLLH